MATARCPSLSTGQKEQEANNWLEKRYKTDPNPSLSYDDTVQLALACLQNVLGSDLKADDVEVWGPCRGLRAEPPARLRWATLRRASRPRATLPGLRGAQLQLEVHAVN